MKIKFNSEDDLPLNKSLKFHAIAIPITFVFEEGGKLYPKAYLGECFYELRFKATYKCQNTIEIIFQKELMLIKQMHRKNAIFVTIGILKIFVLSINHIFAMVVMV